MEHKDNQRDSADTRNTSQGHQNNQLQGHDKSQQTGGISFIVRKAEKLTTALYMVTDIMSEREPMKWKARETGVELLSDIMVVSASGSSERMTILRNVAKKIEQIVSFLDVAQSTRMMSEMNASVLKKEYVALKDAVMTEWQRTHDNSKDIFTESFFEVPQDGLRSGLSLGRPDLEEAVRLDAQPSEKNFKDTTRVTHAEEIHTAPQKTSQGQQANYPERVLEQKQFPKVMHGEVVPSTATQKTSQGHHFEKAARPHTQPLAPKVVPPTRPAFAPRATISPTGIIERPRQDVGRDDRRKIILALIKQKPALTVKDIAKSIPGVSEKTIQRELSAMVSDRILIKKGDRRWSTYSLAV